MIDVNAILEARDAGEIRICWVTDYSGDLSIVLSKFGLIADSSLLDECDLEKAEAILTSLFWKDMAYRIELMQKERAETLAGQILAAHKDSQSRYYSNAGGSNPLTESTFDSGLIIETQDHRYFCIWLEDED